MKSLSLSQPHIIAVIGVPGSGKTFFADKFSDTFHAPYVSYDTILGLSGSSLVAGKRLYHYQIDELLKTRQSIIIEGMTDTRPERNELHKKAQAAGYQVLLVWVQIDPETAHRRATKRSNDPNVRVYTDDEYDRTVKRFSTPIPAETSIVVSGKHTYASQAKVILKKLSTPRAEVSTQTVTPTRDQQPDPRTSRHNITVR